MKQLFLVRHAKSSWDDTNQPDFERTLNERGLKVAPLMGRLFAEKFKSPQAWFSSPAVRAMETAKFFAKASTKPFNEIQIAPDLYSFDLQKVIGLVESCDDKFNSAIYFFHNPTITELLHHYTNEILSVPTCTTALVKFDVDSWKHLSRGSGALKHFDFPKKHL
ncbi:MAG TPA: histidine phosphatase family protein [Chitinophagales bacterium]|nr:histidine phosphatase family protein [Chitinophagales bacterium]